MSQKNIYYIIITLFFVIASCKPISSPESKVKLPQEPKPEKQIMKPELKKKSPPAIVFDSMAHDIGELQPNISKDFQLHFGNDGQQDLKITYINSSSNCKVKELKKVIYKPGESGFLEGKFTAASFTGKQQGKVVILSNDPKMPKATIVINSKAMKNSDLPNNNTAIPTKDITKPKKQVEIIRKSRK